MAILTPRAKRLWGYLRPYWKLELATLLATAATGVLQLALPAALQYLIDVGIPEMIAHKGEPGYWHSAVWFGAVVIGVYAIVFFMSWARDYLGARVGSSIVVDLRAELFERLEYLPLRFYQKHQVGEILSRMMSDVSRIQDVFANVLVSALANLMFLLAILSYLLYTNWLLTLLALAPIPLTWYLTHRFGLLMNKVSRQFQETTAELSARVQESLVGVKTIKAFGREQDELGRMSGILERLKRVIVRFTVTQSISRTAIMILSFMGVIVVLSIGSYFIVIGQMTLGRLIAFFFLMAWMMNPIQILASARVDIQSIMASVDRVFEYLDQPIEIVEAPQSLTLTSPRGEVRFDRVSFAYDGQGFRLEDFNLKIAAKEKLAIVGPSGGGKSTIINLVMRFYDPQSGTVMLDGVDLRQLSFRSLRACVALVDQDPLLFNTTILENIAYGKPGATRDEVIAAAKVANVHDFISGLPGGYDTVVGERGVTLSGGEKQRLCLARAVIRDPAVLILDEATSALDSISEHLIQDALERILVNKTAIIVAHRLATVQRADRIITVKNGAIVDEGTHTELLTRSSIYRELAEKQFVGLS
ncbi:MAG: ABC transporter ATP-binding protein [candidate division Zixibacteria bacterium]|nr:ABC transporter ATP-binding protein [candidate division Zixibacteria bacterium]